MPEWKYCPKCGRDLEENFFRRSDELYCIGHGITSPRSKKIRYFIRAAELGNIAAKKDLAEIYFFGRGVEVDYKEALKWRLSFREQQKRDDDWDLGSFLFQRLLMEEKEIAERLEWLESEADKGDIAAQICLADVLYDGEIIERDLDKSKRLLQSATEKGSQYAQRLLARYFKE